MTLLGKIRQKSWLLVGFIVIALASFLINPDTIEKIFSKDPNIFGEVNGDKITREEYIDALMMLQQQAQQQGMPTTGLEEQAWQSVVQSKLIKQEFDKLGLKLTEDFFWNQLPTDPLFAQDPNFKVEDFKKEIEKLKETGKVEEYNNWLRFRKAIENRMMARQLFANISVGITSNKKEAEVIMKNRDEVANIDFVKVDYTTFAQKNPIKVTSQDLAEYIKKHPLAFKTTESRNLGLVYFKAEPTKNDEEKIFEEINKLTNEGVDLGHGVESFRNNKSDSLFVLANSVAGFNPNYFAKEHLPQGIREQISGASIGQVFGPYKEQNYYVTSKLLGKKTSDSTRSKHILIAYQGLQTASGDAAKRTKADAKALAEKISTEVKANPSKFDEYLNLSADGSSQSGGDLGWVTSAEPKFVPEFQSFVDKNPKGAVGVVETQFGYHIINITDKKSGEMTYKVANLVKEIKPSDATVNKVHAQSTAFGQKIQGKSFNDFVNIARKENYNFQNPKMVQRFQGGLLGTDKDEEILRWAFDKKREKGDNEMFTATNGDRVIVYFNGKQEEGLADPESVREQIEPIVKNQLLAKKIIEKISSAKASSLEQVAKLFGVSKNSAQINLLHPMLGVAMEPKVAGAVFGVAKNKVSKPVEGNTGVYVVVNKGVVLNKQTGDVKQVQEGLAQQYASMFPQGYMRSLQNNAKIKDYRIEVYDRGMAHQNQ